MLRTVRPDDLVSKTIKQADCSSINVVKIIFTDGTSLELWAESAVNTSFGSAPGIFVDDPSIKSAKLQDDRVL